MEEKKLATLRFKREELLYDIENYAYIEGHVMGEENQHARHTLVDIAQEGNIDRVNRILGVVYAAAVEMLYPMTKQEVIEGVLSDKLEAPEEYVIELTVPEDMSATTLRLLSKLIHEFMVYRALHDWLGITHPDAAEKWLVKAMEAGEEIGDIKHLRRGVLTRKSSPF